MGVQAAKRVRVPLKLSTNGWTVSPKQDPLLISKVTERGSIVGKSREGRRGEEKRKREEKSRVEREGEGKQNEKEKVPFADFLIRALFVDASGGCCCWCACSRSRNLPYRTRYTNKPFILPLIVNLLSYSLVSICEHHAREVADRLARR